MEYLLVSFAKSRTVLVDDSPQGKTNKILSLSKGTYTVSLEPSSDIKPKEVTVALKGTTPIKPKKVKFEAA